MMCGVNKSLGTALKSSKNHQGVPDKFNIIITMFYVYTIPGGFE